jgi:hypothetical protein
MKRLPSALGSLCALILVPSAEAQSFQQESRFKFRIDGLARQEWTYDVPGTPDDSRRRFQSSYSLIWQPLHITDG